jgi:hypothetical protein
MKKFVLIILLVAVTVVCRATDITGVVCGQELTMDGTVQKITLTATPLTGMKLLKDGCITLYFYVDAAGGAKIGAATTTPTLSATRLFVTDARVIVSIIPGQLDVYIQGTNGQKITVTF